MTPGPIEDMGLKSVGISPRCKALNSRPALRRADLGKLRRSSLEDETQEIDLFNIHKYTQFGIKNKDDMNRTRFFSFMTLLRRRR